MYIYFFICEFFFSDRQMDKHGKGEISLEEFKDGLVERWAVLDDTSLASASRPVSRGVY